MDSSRLTIGIQARAPWQPAYYELSSEINSFHLLAIISVILYEYLDTFSREVNRIWHRKMDTCSALFIINRYSILLSATLLMIHFITWEDVNANSAQLACEAVSRTCAILYSLGRCAVYGMAAMRMYGIWFRDKRILAVLLILGSIDPVISVVDSSLYNVVVVPNGCDQVLKPGLPSGLPAILRTIAMTVTITFDALVLLLTWTKTAKDFLIQRKLHIDRRHSLTYLLARDGTTYFLAITALNVLCLVCLRDNGSQFVTLFLRCASQPFGTDVMPVVINAMTAVLISRWVLNLRDFESYSTHSHLISGSFSRDQDAQMSSVQFVHSDKASTSTITSESLMDEVA